MSVWRAIGQGLDLTRRFWTAVLAFLLVYAFFGMLSTVLLPFEVVNGRVRVPMPSNPSDAASRLIVALGIYFGMVGLSVWLLGGVLTGTGQILEKKPFSQGELFRAGVARFWSMIGWVTGYAVSCMGAGVAAAFLLGFIAAVSGQATAMKSLAGLGFSSAGMVAGLLFLYSPAAIIQNSAGVWRGFGDSFRFVKRHGLATVALVFWISVIGALIWWFGVLVLARASGAIRAAMGIAPFAAGLPVFFFGLINGLPQAILSVFVPASLYAYYHGSPE